MMRMRVSSAMCITAYFRDGENTDVKSSFSGFFSCYKIINGLCLVMLVVERLTYNMDC